ncbi:MAG: HAD hydrolase family protein [Saprospiraceae bacterium]
MINVFDKLALVQALVLDVDGVFTDNNILVTDQGEFFRTMNVRDGYAIRRALAAGLKIGIITGGKSIGIIKRMNMLGIVDIHLGIEDKLSVFKSLLEKWNIAVEHSVYMGDDLPDIDCMKIAGLAACPRDSVPEILEICEYISTLDGGKGCIRQLIEQILQAQDKW